MTPTAAWREALEKATPGPWSVHDQRPTALLEFMRPDAELIVSLRSVAEAMVKWFEAKADYDAHRATEKPFGSFRSENAWDDEAYRLEDAERMAEQALHAAMVAAVTTEKGE